VPRRLATRAVVAVLLGLTLGLLAAPQRAARADLPLVGNVGKVLKLFGIGYAVSELAPSLDKFINKLLAQHEAKIRDATKVVPILKVGGGDAAVGAAQVTGPAEQVRQVQAVAQLDLEVSRLRGRALIPVSTRKGLTSSIRGVDGVGVSATIKFKL